MEVTPWQLYHTYETLVDKGIAPPIVHPGCDPNRGMVGRIYPNEAGDFALWCSQCGSMTRPGLSVLRDIEAVVKEFFDVRLTV